ncbi:MAG: STAS domain-containing protein [Fimbriimonadaceae bacterium]|nr:STAS domain-containing protein [Fimbriimonadaceae bacterium]QYK55688.1 MAG: STAS domain-containing protein [Fimbriimonadaceae bacterium]
MKPLAWDRFTPKAVVALRTYNLATFTRDLIAGVTVGLVALPLAMAFAISSGVLPQAGLYCAVTAGFIISALGGSTTQIGGPTGAFVVVVAGIVQKHGLDGLFMCTLMAGFLLVVLGATGLGSAVKFIPRPVVIGFTNGIAVLIASTQIKDFFGLDIPKPPGEFLPRMQAVIAGWGTLSLPVTLLSVSCLVVIVLMARFVKKVPGTLVALVVGTLAALALHLPVETILSRFGGIAQGPPTLRVPTFRPELIAPLLSPTITVTMLGAIESLLSAVVADRMSGDRHNPNVELVAQGVANMVSPLFGGLPATGAIARTATNIRSGAKTPVAGMVHALTLLAILLFAAPLVKPIPLCVLAAILMVVSYNMGEWREIPDILKQSKASAAVWLTTFALTVFADLTVAVEAGMIVAALLFINQVTTTTTVRRVTREYVEEGRKHSLQTVAMPEGVAIYRIHGPFLFGASDKLSIVEDDLESLPPVVVVRLRNMTAIDSTGLHALEHLADVLQASGRHLIVCGLRKQPGKLMEKAEFHRHIGEENIVASLEDAADRARQLLGSGAAV